MRGVLPSAGLTFWVGARRMRQSFDADDYEEDISAKEEEAGP